MKLTPEIGSQLRRLEGVTNRLNSALGALNENIESLKRIDPRYVETMHQYRTMECIRDVGNTFDDFSSALVSLFRLLDLECRLRITRCDRLTVARGSCVEHASFTSWAAFNEEPRYSADRYDARCRHLRCT